MEWSHIDAPVKRKFQPQKSFCSIGPKYVVSDRKEFAEKKHSKLLRKTIAVAFTLGDYSGL